MKCETSVDWEVDHGQMLVAPKSNWSMIYYFSFDVSAFYQLQDVTAGYC